MSKNSYAYKNNIEFIIMLFLTFISPVFLLAFSLILLLWRNSNQWKLSILGLSVSIAIFAIYIDPSYGDLIRYYGFLDKVRNYTLVEAVNYFNDGLFVENFLFWTISKTGVNGFLPAVATGVTYYVAMYITAKTAVYFEQQRYIKWLILLQILLLPFVSIANNVRNVMAFALIILACYRDMILRKKNFLTLLLYVLPCFLHATAIMFVLIRIVVPIIRKSYILIISLPFIAGIVINVGYTSSNLFGNIPLIQKFIIKAYNYLGDADTEYGQIVANSRLQIVLRILFIFLTLFVAYVLFNRRKRVIPTLKDKGIDGWNHMVFLICMLILFCCAQYTTPAYWRFFVIISIVLSTFFLPASKEMGEKFFSYKFYIIFGFGVIISFCNIYYAASNYHLISWVKDFIFNREMNFLYLISQY